MKLAEFKEKWRFTLTATRPFNLRRRCLLYPEHNCHPNRHAFVAELEIAGKKQEIVLVD